jgi:phosphoglycerate dehydrogenase-like enzyme
LKALKALSLVFLFWCLVIKIAISFSLDKKNIEKITSNFETIEIEQSINEKELISLIGEAEVLFGGIFSPKIFEPAKKLRWIQTTGAGVEQFLIPQVVNSQVVVTNAGTIFSSAMAEHVFALMLSLTKKMRFFNHNQETKRWDRLGGYLGQSLDGLKGKTVGIVGFGSVGQKVARIAKAFDMKVITNKDAPEKPKYVDKMVSRQNLDLLLAKSDFVVLTLPYTFESEGLIGQEQLKRMKKSSFLINISRGKIVKEDALVEALEEGWISGAGLDVFEQEPLPATSKLWEFSNVVITPHMAGVTKHFLDNITDVFCENFKRFQNNEPLNFVVNKKKGY